MKNLSKITSAAEAEAERKDHEAHHLLDQMQANELIIAVSEAMKRAIGLEKKNGKPFRDLELCQYAEESLGEFARFFTKKDIIEEVKRQLGNLHDRLGSVDEITIDRFVAGEIGSMMQCGEHTKPCFVAAHISTGHTFPDMKPFTKKEPDRVFCSSNGFRIKNGIVQDSHYNKMRTGERTTAMIRIIPPEYIAKLKAAEDEIKIARKRYHDLIDEAARRGRPAKVAEVKALKGEFFKAEKKASDDHA